MVKVVNTYDASGKCREEGQVGRVHVAFTSMPGTTTDLPAALPAMETRAAAAATAYTRATTAAAAVARKYTNHRHHKYYGREELVGQIRH